MLEQIRAEPVRLVWLYGAAAVAEYLGWPTKRVYNRLEEIPHRREGRRLVFSVRELDEYLDGLK